MGHMTWSVSNRPHVSKSVYWKHKSIYRSADAYKYKTGIKKIHLKFHIIGALLGNSFSLYLLENELFKERYQTAADKTSSVKYKVTRSLPDYHLL